MDILVRFFLSGVYSAALIQLLSIAQGTKRFYLSIPYIKQLFIIPPQTKFGGYIGITLSVHPSMYLVSATPPKPRIGFL